MSLVTYESSSDSDQSSFEEVVVPSMGSWVYLCVKPKITHDIVNIFKKIEMAVNSQIGKTSPFIEEQDGNKFSHKNSWYSQFQMSAKRSAFSGFVFEPPGDLFSAEKYNSMINEANKRSFARLAEKIQLSDQEKTYDTTKSQNTFILFEPLYIDPKGYLLHMSLTSRSILESKAHNNAAFQELQGIVKEFREYRDPQRLEIAKELFPDRLASFLDSNLIVDFATKLDILPNSNFSKLYLVVRPLQSSRPLCQFFVDMVKQVPFYRDNCDFSSVDDFHVSFSEIKLPFVGKSNHLYNVMFCEKIQEIISKINIDQLPISLQMASIVCSTNDGWRTMRLLS